MKQTIKYLLCPHCINSDHPLENNGVSWLKCPLCGESFRSGEIRGNAIMKSHLSQYLQEKLASNKDVDSQMDNMVQESTDNLMHEIIMVRIFGKKPQKAEEQAIKTGIDKIFDIVLGRA
jgi:uncharacterized C2H2 Zn-finger protein